MNQATSSTVATNIAITIKATDVITTIANLIIVIEMIAAMIVVNVMTRTRGTTSSTTRRMIASAITSRKRVTRPCTMTSTLCQAPAICPEKGVNLDLLHALALVLVLARAAGATKIIMSNNMIASQVQRPNASVHTPKTTMTNITIAQRRGIAFPYLLCSKSKEK
jgi:hypothetical protein